MFGNSGRSLASDVVHVVESAVMLKRCLFSIVWAEAALDKNHQVGTGDVGPRAIRSVSPNRRTVVFEQNLH